MPYEVFQKVVISGSFLEHYQYEKPYYVGFPALRSLSVSRPFRATRTEDEQKAIRANNVRLTKQKIRRLVNSNPDLNNFLTLTFNRPMPDLSVANKIFMNFVKRMVRAFPGFRYLCVPEFQSDYDYFGRLKPDRGSVHYHLLCNHSLPSGLSAKEIKAYERFFDKQYWQNGFVKLKPIDNIGNVGTYVCKYMSKDLFDKRYFKKRKFFYSSTLNKPVVIDNPFELKDFFSAFPLDFFAEPLFESEPVLTRWLGLVYYKQYKLLEIKVDDSFL